MAHRTGRLPKAAPLRSLFTMGKAKAVAEDAAEPELKEKKRSKKEKEADVDEAPPKEKKKRSKDSEDKPAKKAKKAAEPDEEAPAPKKSKAKAKEAAAEEDAPAAAADDPNSLDNFELSPAVRTKLRECGIAALFPIQAATFRHVMDGFDLVGRARTGQARRPRGCAPLSGRCADALCRVACAGQDPGVRAADPGVSGSRRACGGWQAWGCKPGARTRAAGNCSGAHARACQAGACVGPCTCAARSARSSRRAAISCPCLCAGCATR